VLAREKPADLCLTYSLKVFLMLAPMVLLGLLFGACKRETPAPRSSPPIPPARQAATVPQASPALPSARPAAGSPTGAAEKPAAAQPAEYSYNPGGRPDPFVPLVLPQQVAEKGKKGLENLQVSELKLTGIVWDKKGYVALVEAPDGLGYVLKVHDLIGNAARVTRITTDSVTFEVKEQPYLPQSRVREVELKLKKEG
jgi:type IV pilus assembly protein PilP